MTIITAEDLTNVGICGSNTSRFRKLFPDTDERYFDGVQVSRELCEEHFDQFSWTDAASYLLNHDAQREHRNRVYGSPEQHDEVTKVIVADEKKIRDEFNTQIKAWRKQYKQNRDYPEWDTDQKATDAYNALESAHNTVLNEVQARRRRHDAGTFGELLADPANHSTRLVESLRTIDARRDQRRQMIVSEVEDELARARRELADSIALVEKLTPMIPELEQKLARIRVQYHEWVIRRAEARVMSATEELAAARLAVEKLTSAGSSAEAAEAAETTEDAS